MKIEKNATNISEAAHSTNNISTLELVHQNEKWTLNALLEIEIALKRDLAQIN